jgi:cysteinyl-tRNA synthetase
MATELKLYNTLTRSKETFKPIDPHKVRMYVCGPTVYDFAHIGNARPVIVFDVLFRLLRHLYGEKHVTYVRNITDVDDKINARALRDFPELPLNDAIARVTAKTANQFHEDVKALGCLEPTHEPRATKHIDGMVDIIQLLLDRDHAYVATGGEGREVLFAVGSMLDYGQLSKRKLEHQQAGARVAVEAHKRNPGDFVLWKESASDQPGWPASFKENGAETSIFGRPGWHIECSAMSKAFLGEKFDIHGGGLDLIFPHHENEIAQSRCAHGTYVMANVWMHNGFLQVEGRKMSKSEGNFVTIHELLHTEKFGGRAWHAQAARLAMLRTHYREPIDWSVGSLNRERNELFIFADYLRNFKLQSNIGLGDLDEEFIAHLSNDLDTPSALARLAHLRKQKKGGVDNRAQVAAALRFLGVENLTQSELFDEGYLFDPGMKVPSDIAHAIELARVAHNNNSPSLRSMVKSYAAQHGLRFVDIKPGLVSIAATGKNVQMSEIEDRVETRIQERRAFLAAKNFAEADRIRDELLAQGIQLKDSKDPVTGERVTAWEVKR